VSRLAKPPLLTTPTRPTLALRSLMTLLAALTLLACPAGDLSERERQGQALFLRTCASCHGPDAGGMPNLGEGLRGNTFVGIRSVPELVDFLKTGRPAWDPANRTGITMPPKGGNPALTDSDLTAIAVFLKALPDD